MCDIVTSESSADKVNEPGPRKCLVCEKTFNKSVELKIHMVVHSKIKMLHCNMCSKSFCNRGTLYAHIATHTNIYNYSCDVCNKKFTDISRLKSHYFVHTREKPHTCEKCNASFSHKATLNKHMVIHTRDPLVCNVCGEKFERRIYLAHHYRKVHRNKSLFVCGICNKEYLKPSYLARHYRSHKELKPHVCKLCKQGFSKEQELINHAITCQMSQLEEIPDMLA